MGKIARRCWKLLALTALPAALGLLQFSQEAVVAAIVFEAAVWLVFHLLRWLKPITRLRRAAKRLMGWLRRLRPGKRGLVWLGATAAIVLWMTMTDGDEETILSFATGSAMIWLAAHFCARLRLFQRLTALVGRLFGWVERLGTSVKNAALVVLSLGTLLCLTFRLWEALAWMALFDMTAALMAAGMWLRQWLKTARENNFRPKDLSIQATYVVYVVIALVAAAALCVLTWAGIDQWRSQLAQAYLDDEIVLSVPVGGSADSEMAQDSDEYGYVVIYDARKRALERCEVDMRTSAISYYYEGEYTVEDDFETSPAYNRVSVQPYYSHSDRALEMALGALQLLCIPILFVGAIVCCAMTFYRRKLREPIAVLSAAAEQIAANSLDFRVEYDCRDEMGRLCESFETMRGALKQTNEEMWRQMEERRRLNAAFSHDLRTPLTVLKGHAEMLRAGLPDGSVSMDEAMQELEAMSGSIARLENYVAAMSKLQRLEDVEIHPEDVSAQSFAQELRESASILCGACVSMTASPGVVWRMDPEVVMQVVENLLTNAARYAQNQATLNLEESSGRLIIEVCDDGPGFSEADLQKATEPFYRGDRSGQGHLGLGLNICRILCERHGGGIAVSNRAEGGARVRAWIALGKT